MDLLTHHTRLIQYRCIDILSFTFSYCWDLTDGLNSSDYCNISTVKCFLYLLFLYGLPRWFHSSDCWNISTVNLFPLACIRLTGGLNYQLLKLHLYFEFLSYTFSFYLSLEYFGDLTHQITEITALCFFPLPCIFIWSAKIGGCELPVFFSCGPGCSCISFFIIKKDWWWGAKKWRAYELKIDQKDRPSRYWIDWADSSHPWTHKATGFIWHIDLILKLPITPVNYKQ